MHAAEAISADATSAASLVKTEQLEDGPSSPRPPPALEPSSSEASHPLKGKARRTQTVQENTPSVLTPLLPLSSPASPLPPLSLPLMGGWDWQLSASRGAAVGEKRQLSVQSRIGVPQAPVDRLVGGVDVGERKVREGEACPANQSLRGREHGRHPSPQGQTLNQGREGSEPQLYEIVSMRWPHLPPCFPFKSRPVFQ